GPLRPGGEGPAALRAALGRLGRRGAGGLRARPAPGDDLEHAARLAHRAPPARAPEPRRRRCAGLARGPRLELQPALDARTDRDAVRADRARAHRRALDGAPRLAAPAREPGGVDRPALPHP